MTDTDVVVCGRHGETPVTWMCVHLVMGVACGLHHGNAKEGDSRPDAWCDACNERFLANGSWTDEATEEADIKILCTHCYDEVRGRNETIPGRARGEHVRMSDDERDAFVELAVHTAQALQKETDAKWQFTKYERWDFDAKQSSLTFSDSAKPTIVADVVVVGTFSTNTNTFQWSWSEARDDEISLLRGFGTMRGVTELATLNFDSDEAHAWSFAAIAGYLLGCEAYYRAPMDHLYVFMLLRNLRKAMSFPGRSQKRSFR